MDLSDAAVNLAGNAEIVQCNINVVGYYDQALIGGDKLYGGYYCDTALDNWIHTAKGNGYNYSILGLDEKWKGWAWRTKKYLKFVETLPSTSIVCITDCNDVLFVKPESDMKEVWDYYHSKGHDLIFGGEPTCCTGDYRYHINPIGRKRLMSKVKSYQPKNRWMFPNAGCIIGTRNRVHEALTLAKDANDDQARYLEQYTKDKSWLTIDYDHKLVGNLNALAILYKNTSIPLPTDDYYNAELKHWDIVSQYPELLDGSLTMISPPVTMNQLKNKTTGGTPCVIHFPGKNYVLYNHIGKELFHGDFKPVPFSDKMATLWSIATLWK